MVRMGKPSMRKHKKPSAVVPSSEVFITRKRKVALMDLLCKYQMQVKVHREDDWDENDDQKDATTILSLEVVSEKGGVWSDDFEFQPRNGDSYFLALEQAIASWIAKNTRKKIVPKGALDL